MNTIELKGIDGSSPIGMLAALGALRVATLQNRLTRMGWNTGALPFYPILETSLTVDEFAEAVCVEACRVAASVVTYGDMIKIDSEKYRQAAESHMPQDGLPGDLTDSDYFAGFACDAITEEGFVQPSMLSFSNNSGGQLLFKDFKNLANACSIELVMSNILHNTPTLAACTCLNWDSNSFRSYAYRGDMPTGKNKQTNVPMNVLAFLGLASISSTPSRRALTTVGFDAKGKNWCWSIWDGLIPYATVCALFTSPITAGIAYRYSARRFSENKRFFFAPATQQ